MERKNYWLQFQVNNKTGYRFFKFESYSEIGITYNRLDLYFVSIMWGKE